VSTDAAARLDTAIAACRQHAVRLRSAMEVLASLMPLDGSGMAHLDDEGVRALDQFVYRFGKLQDACGNQLFSALLDVLQEPVREWSMRDRMNRLEQLGYLTRLDDWDAIRAVRNRLVHEYPDDPARQAAILALAWRWANPLLDIAEHVAEVAEREGRR
jgi:hypothetical protein